MKLLFCGDVVGRSGRRQIADVVPQLKRIYNLDVVIVNGENAAHGFGLTPKLFDELVRFGADIVTLGNHSFDKADVVQIFDRPMAALVRPLNYPENTVGRGFVIKELSCGIKIAVVQLLGRIFMRPVTDPFQSISEWLETYKKGRDYDVLVVDFHAEATAEKRAMGAFLDGKALLVVGTHTHIPTADACVLPGGTGYMTDVGMCGDYLSVIGMQTQGALARFLTPNKTTRLSPAEDVGTFCGVIVEWTPDQKGMGIQQIFPVRVGAHLENTINL